MLLQEASDFQMRRAAVFVLCFRREAWKETEFGNEGMDGVSLFYPRVSLSTLQTCVQECLRYLRKVHRLVHSEQHDFQWDLCIFGKSISAYMKVGVGSLGLRQLSRWLCGMTACLCTLLARCFFMSLPAIMVAPMSLSVS